MTANLWLLSFHLIALFVWLGQMLYLSRFLGYHVDESADVRPRLSRMQKRMYLFIDLPGGILVLITGMMLLHGVAYPGFASPGDALSNYLNPRTTGGEPSLWYVTFHVKLVSFVLLALLDAYVGVQVFRLANEKAVRRGWPLGAIMAVSGALIAHVTVWLSLSSLGVGAARPIGYSVALVTAVAGFVGGRKLALKDSRAKYSAIHGLIAALLMLIVILIIARPLQGGGPTLG